MMNAEQGTGGRPAAFDSAFIIHHSAFHARPPPPRPRRLARPDVGRARRLLPRPAGRHLRRQLRPVRRLRRLYTDWAVMIGLVYGELPFMILPLYASLEKLDRSLLEAAADLGAGGWSTFRRVTLPLSAPGLVAGTVLVFVPSLGQFVVSDL